MSKRRNLDFSAGKDGSSSVDAKGKSPSLYRRRVLGQDATNYVMKAKDRYNEKNLKGSNCKPSLESSNSNKGDSSSASMDASKEPDPCCICLDAIKVRGQIDSCDHRYCFGCIKRWSKETNQCPQCKKRFHQIEKVNEDKISTKSPSRKRRRKNSSTGADRKSSKRVVKIKNKDITVNHGHEHIHGLLTRIFDHFELQPLLDSSRSTNRTRTRSPTGRIFHIRSGAYNPLFSLPSTSSENPIDLVSSNLYDNFVRPEVESDDLEPPQSRMSRILNTLWMTNMRNRRRAVDDGRGVSTETAISLIDSEDEDESNAECHVSSEDESNAECHVPREVDIVDSAPPLKRRRV